MLCNPFLYSFFDDATYQQLPFPAVEIEYFKYGCLTTDDSSVIDSLFNYNVPFCNWMIITNGQNNAGNVNMRFNNSFNCLK